MTKKFMCLFAIVSAMGVVTLLAQEGTTKAGEGTLMLEKKTYPLKHALAYETTIDSDPAVKGKIDRLGYFQTDDSRYAISPYMQYRSENDLLQVHRCATDRRVPAAAYYRCFVMDEDGPRTVGRPLALQELRGKAR